METWPGSMAPADHAFPGSTEKEKENKAVGRQVGQKPRHSPLSCCLPGHATNLTFTLQGTAHAPSLSYAPPPSLPQHFPFCLPSPPLQALRALRGPLALPRGQENVSVCFVCSLHFATTSLERLWAASFGTAPCTLHCQKAFCAALLPS